MPHNSRNVSHLRLILKVLSTIRTMDAYHLSDLLELAMEFLGYLLVEALVIFTVAVFVGVIS